MRGPLFKILVLACLILAAVAVSAGHGTNSPSHDTNGYTFYVFGDDCPEGGCMYACSTPTCEGEIAGYDTTISGQQDGVNLEIIETSHPARFGAGEEINFRVTVQNQGDTDAENVRLRVQAYGQTKDVDSISIGSGETRTVDVPFTIPVDASGPATVEIEAAAFDDLGNLLERDIATVKITVADAFLSMRLNPTRVTVGDLVEVRGMMSAPNMDAELYVGGSHVTTITSDEARQYSHTIEARQPGFHRVELRAGQVRETAYLRVDPDLGVLDMNVPETANTQDRFDACATVTSATQQDVRLTLLVDGVERAERTFPLHGQQDECFRISISEAGERDITLRLEGDGVADEMTQRMQVVESRIEVNVFPGQMTVARGSSGIFQVQIHNRDAHPRTYYISVSGLEDISELTHEQVSLGHGERRTTFIRVSPQESGVYHGNITVTSDDRVFADRSVTVFSQEDPRLRGPLDRLRSGLADAADYVRNRAAAIGLGIVALVVLIGILIMLRRRAQRRDVVEPRY